MRRVIYILFVLLQARIAVAQDPHHTQYFNMPVYYNPAAAGHNVEHIRATAVYRQQWPSLQSPFITQGLLFDKQVSRVGMGAILNSNNAGPAGIRRLQFGGMISYRHKLNAHTVGAGVYTGIIQKSFDPSEMTFDDQYVDDAGYSATHQTSEYFAFTKVVRPDFGAGIQWSMGEDDKQKFQPFFGVGLLHINQPHEVFIEEFNVTAMRQTLNGGAKIEISDFIDLKPSGLYSVQQSSQELMYGCLTSLKLDDREVAEAGLYIRHDESAIAYVGYRWNSLMAGLSYDITTSSSVSGPGAFEMTLTYIPKAKPKKEKKKTEADNEVPAKKPAPAVKPPVSQKPVQKPLPQPAAKTTDKPAPAQTMPKENTVQKPAQTTEKPVTTAPKPVPVPQKQPVPVADPAPISEPVKPVQKIDYRKNAMPVVTEKKQQSPSVIAPSPAGKASDLIQKTEPAPQVSAVQQTSETEPIKPVQKINYNKTATPVTTEQNHKVPPSVTAPATSGKASDLNERIITEPQVTAPAAEVTVQQPIERKTDVTEFRTKPVQPAPVKRELGSFTPRATAKYGRMVENDRDADGVPDSRDKCPDRPGLASDNGCPASTASVDADNDGILNDKDECPYLKGDAAGRGCPDTDMDGVHDGIDKCPLTKGNPENGGCPVDYIYTEAKNYIRFENNSVKINGFDIIDILEPVSDMLYYDPAVTIVIAGHTDDEGNDYYNMILSQNRADAVKDYFIRHGVDERRIRTVAYGETHPRVSNETEYGRNTNRRAEVFIMR